MSQYGCRGRTWPPITRTIPDLRVTNYDLMQRDVTIEVTDETHETVFVAERSIARGGDLTCRSVFPMTGTYQLTISLRYGATTTTTHTVTPDRKGICLDIHPDSIDTYSVSQ